MSNNTIVDAHQHFWKLERGDYSWLSEDLVPLNRNYFPEELEPQLKETGVQKTILVQTTQTLEESLYLLDVAENAPFVAGYVGWVDMEFPHVMNDLARLTQSPMLVGIRPKIEDIADPDWMLKPELDSAFQLLMKKRLTFDALVKPFHLPNLKTLLARYPDLPVVINHGAKPCIERGDFDMWATDMTDIARDSKTFCKISGLLTEAGERARFETLKPYVHHLLSVFGPERCMWGSDWPVLRLASEYGDWFAMTQELFSGLSEGERQQVMGETAIRFYGLPEEVIFQTG